MPAWMKVLRTLVAATLLMGLGLSYGSQPTMAADPGEPLLPPFQLLERGNPRLDSALNQLVSSGASKKATASGQHGIAELSDKVRVVVESLPDQIGAAREAARGLGTLETEYGDLLQVVVPVSHLTALADSPGVGLVRLPDEFLSDVVSEGVSLINADEWQSANLTGAGVKIGIIDGGFSGYTTRQAEGELPATISTWWAPSINGTGSSIHGTGCAEIVYDIAPGAQMYLANVGTDVELGNAVDWMIAQGVQVISHSMGWPISGPGNGTGAVATIVDRARAAGILWVNAAGNSAQRHWQGSFINADGDQYHEFAPGDETNTINVTSGQLIVVQLKWDDPWSASGNDYDLLLFNSSGGLVALSQNIQDGNDRPREQVTYVATYTGSYGIAIGTLGAPAVRNFHLYSYFHNLQYQVASGSLAVPADSPNALAVGAVPWHHPESIEPFSSRGPTTDNRTKPDIVAPDGVNTRSYGTGGFYGTSASAPHAAGAAALVKQRYPSYTPAQVQSFLESRAVGLGDAGKDNIFGSGRLDLGGLELPLIVTTDNATNITSNSAKLNGTLDGLGTAASVNVSFQWGPVSGNYTGTTPAVSMNATGAFSANITGLSLGKTYYFRAKAVGDGTGYGAEKSFRTRVTVPEVEWQKTFGGANGDYAFSVQPTADGGYIIGGSTGSFGAYDVYLIKTDSSGNMTWSQTFGGANDDQAFSVQPTADGGYIIAGFTKSFGAGLRDVYLVKTDSLGNMTWSRTFGGSADDLANSVQQTSDSGYIIAGYTNSFGAGFLDVYLIKTDSSGNMTWSRTFGGVNEDVANSVQQTSDSGYIITGRTASFGAGLYDVYLVKTDSSGNMTWSKTFGGVDYDGANSVQQTTDGGYIVSGVTTSFGAGSADVYLIKTDSSGNMTWSRTFGGVNEDVANSVQPTSDGGYIIAGYTKSFGVGGYDVYLIKVAGPTATTPPTVTTDNATNITTSSATMNGSLTSLGTASSANVSFQWGLSSGNYTFETTPVSMNATGAFSANLTGLSAQTTYYFRAKAVAGNVTAYGAEKSFTTLPLPIMVPPTVTTDNATSITSTSARVNGTLTGKGSAASVNVSFQWGLSSGNYTFETSLVSMNATGAFSANITGLTPATTYYFRAKAVGSVSYGVEKSFTTVSLPSDLQWQKTFGGTGIDEGRSVQQTADGGYIIAGSTNNLVVGSAVYLIKTDASGTMVWSKTFDGSADDKGYSVQQTADGGYIIAGSTWSFGAGSSDVYLIKADASGNLVWSKTFGGTNSDEGYSVRQTADGGYIIGGYTNSFGAGGWDVYLIKTDASGNMLWSQTFGGGDADYGYSVQPTADGGYIIGGQTSSFGAGGNDVYLIKTDASSNTVWSQTFGGTSHDGGYSVQPTADGGYIITGYTKSSGALMDVYLIKTDASGNLTWSQTFGGASFDFGYSVQQTADGGYIVAGWTDSFGAGSGDVYLIKVAADKQAPTVTTDNATNITSTSARLNGTLTSLGTATSVNVSFQWGLTSGNYTFETPLVSMNATGAFSADITGLSANTTYYFRAKAVGDGTGYGAVKSLSTLSLPTSPPIVTSDNATSITLNSARLNGTLSSLGSAASVNLSFLWGLSSGNYTYETTPVSLNATGVFSTNVTGLSANTTYYFQAKAISSGGTGYGAEKSFTTSAAGWYNTSWQYRKRITIDHTKVSANLTNFPVLVSLSSDSDLASKAQDDGDDILFTSADATTKLDLEIERFDGGTGQLVAWVNVPVLSPSIDTVLYLYYGNPSSASQQNTTAVWDANYVMVQHLKDTTSSAVSDSTANGNSGAKTAVNEPAETNGKIGNGQVFDGGNDGINVSDSSSLDITDAITVEAWVKPTGYNNWDRIVAKNWASPGTPYNVYALHLSNDNDGLEEATFGVAIGGVSYGASWSTEAEVPLNIWTQVLGTYDGTTIAIYINGELIISENHSGKLDTNNQSVDIGQGRMYSGESFTGTVDEVRISKTARSAGWIRTSYNNQSNPAGFYTVGSEVTITSPIPPTVTTDNATSITSTSARLNGTLTSKGTAASVNLSFQWGTASGNYTFETPLVSMNATGAFSANLTGLSANTTYFFRAKAVGDGTAYGAEKSFTTLPLPILVPPSVTTDNATSINSNSARLYGTLTSKGTAAWVNVSFQWGLSSGNYTFETTSVSMNATGAFSANLTGLSANTTYYFRAKAVGDGTGYGAEKSFSTLPLPILVPPTVTTDNATSITTNSAILSGTLTSKGTAASVNVSFQWGLSSGNYTFEATSVSMNATGPFSANVTGLSANTTYYFRAKAVGNGPGYGADRTFTTTVSPNIYVSNHDSLPPPINVPQPAVGISFIDPVFKTHVVRITDAKAASRPGTFPDYSKRQAWNSDESLLLLRSDDGATLLFDGMSYQFIKVLEGVAGEDIFWHPTDPALVLYNPGHELWAFNVRTEEQYRVFDFAGFEYANTRGEGNLSQNGAFYAIVGSTYESSTGKVIPKKFILLSLRQEQGRILGEINQSLDLPESVQDLDWISVSPAGNYIVVDYADDVTERFHGVEVYDRSFNLLWQKPLGAGHSDMAIDANGDEVLIMDVYDADSNKTNFMKYRLSDGQETSLLTIEPVFDQHISARNESRPGWVYISTFDYVGRLTDSPETWLPFEDEIFALKLDGSGEVQRFAHHHSRRYSPSTPDSDQSVYWAEPHATVSRNGDRILFGSNWGLNVDQVDSVDAYIINLAGPTATIPPTVTTDNATNITSNSARLNGTLTSKGTAASVNVSFQWGLSSGNYTFETPAVSMNTTGPFSANLTGLSANTTYYFRAKAVGDNMTAYGAEKSFTTVSAVIPGDANGDGVVDAIDIVKVERIIVGMDPPTPGADANRDGVMDARDITRVERIIARLD